jgi:CSLREA domain-containing protein
MHRSQYLTGVFLIVSTLLYGSNSHIPVSAASTSDKDPCKNNVCSDVSDVLTDPFNDRLAILVGSNGLFNIGAFPDPQTGGAITGQSWDLMFRWPSAPWSSYTTIRIDGSDYVYGSTGTQLEAPTDIDSNTNQSIWQIGDMEITQTLQIAFNNQTNQNDVAKISYTVRNTGSVSHTIGTRILIDTEINYNDGAPFRVPGVGIVTTESEYVGSTVPDTFQAFFDVTDSEHVAASTIKTVGETAPDRLVLAGWPHLYDTRYDYTIDPNYDFSNDSAYAVYWNPTTLDPGNEVTNVTYYGLGQLNVDLQPPLALGVSGPAALSVVNNQYSPNPFDVVATVFNNGAATATNVQFTLNLPVGLSLAAGSATQSVGDLAVGQERQISWSVSASPQTSSTVRTYSVTATAFNIQSKTVSRDITIPALLSSVVSDASTYSSDCSADGGISCTAACTQGSPGGPINTRTGGYDYSATDISIQTSAGPLTFARSYSSLTTGIYTDDLGFGWTHNQDVYLSIGAYDANNQREITLKGRTANQYTFTQTSGSSTTIPEPGIYATLTQSPSAFVLTDAAQNQYEFDLTTGKLLAYSDANGHTWNYVYGTNGKLERVSADGGLRYLEITYDAQGRVESVSDHTGRSVTYHYDSNGDLASFIDVLGQTWTYEYDQVLAHLLTRVVAPDNTTVERTEYDSNGRAIRQFDGEGNVVVELTYNTDGTTDVKDGLNNVSTYTYDARGTLIDQENAVGGEQQKQYDNNFRQTSIANEAGHTLSMTWSANGVNLLSKTDPASNTTNYTYDSLNNLTSTTDPKGNTTTYTYDGKLLTSSTDALNGETTYTYTPEGYLESVTDTAGRITTYTYDSFGQRTSMTDPSSNTWNYTYDSLGRLIDTTDPRGRVTHNEYNAAGKLIRVTQNYDPSHIQNYQDLYNIVTEYQYDARGNQIAVTDTYGRTTQYVYDNADRLLQTIDAAGNTTNNTYDAAGHLISTTDPLNHATTYEYDAAGRLVKTINALGYHSGITTFDANTNTSTVTDMLGRQTVFHYDGLGRVIKVVDPLGNFTTTTYDENGNVTTRTDQLGKNTTYEYDALNRLVRTTDPNGGSTQTVYDPSSGYRTATIDPLGHQTTYTYDSVGRLIAATDPLNRTTQMEYDSYGRRIATIDAAGHRTEYTYDLLDRVIAVTDAANHSTHTTYDALGNVIDSTDANGNVTTTTYDVLNRPLVITDANGNETTNTYDAGGNLVAVTDALGHTTSYTYDALNRRISVTDPLNHTTHTSYDSLGNQLETTDANGVATHYEYDALNRQVAVILNYQPNGPTDAETNVRYGFGYNAVGNRVSVTDPNGNVTNYGYDALNRVTSKSDPLGNTWSYTYDLAGNRVSATDAKNQTINYTYDAAGQLTSIDYPGTEPDVSFTYDATGQRNGMTDGLGATSWTYDELNRPTAITDAFGNTIGFGYDAVGNRTGLTYPDGKTVAYTYDNVSQLTGVTDWDNQSTGYIYDAAGHLSSASLPNGVTSQYGYDAAGRLVDLQHVVGANILASYNYTYDPASNLTQAIETVTDPTGTRASSAPPALDNPKQFFASYKNGPAAQSVVAPLPMLLGSSFEVNSTNDTADSNTADGVCRDSTGKCTLRAAIQQANAIAGADTITFNIPGTGVQTIQLTRQNKALPTITGPLVIDATTQPGYSPSTPMIQIDGSLAGAGANGIRISAGSSTVRGLIINRFSGSGIRLDGSGNNVILGNFIGTDASGSLDLGNGYAGIEINGSPNNLIGGASAEARNLISGNEQYGIYIYGSASSGNQVQGNLIGTTLSGSAALGNYRGMYIQGAPNNVVGGTAPGAGNVISASAQYGLYISDAGATGNLVQGNLIGTDISGTIDLGNANRGVHIQGASNNTIGGTEPGAGNLISGNDQYGVYIYGTGTNGNIVQGNTIGLGADGAALGNSDNGVYTQVGAANNTIGGTVPGAGNTIASNGGAGILIYAGNGNAVLGNSIHDNAGLGIDLYPPLGITPNDAGDLDTGTNNLQNFPVITSASSDGTTTTVSGTLNSNPNGSFRIEFFSSPTCDPSGNGEGQTFLGSTVASTDGSGNASFSANLPVEIGGGSVVTATATDAANNSSEFSACATVSFIPPTPTFTPTPIPSGPLTIDYTYDALHRLTSAAYSDGRSFSYTYDAAGNVLELQQNLGPGTVTTTYTYDVANQLSTAQQGSTTWQYTYDANGSLTEVLPNGNVASGAKRYTYNAAGNLVQVEAHNGTGWDTQATMSYNGLNQRLSMNAAGVIAHYVLDGDQLLTAASSGNTTLYLYGRGPIGEKTTDWNYLLPDGTNTPRQLADLNGDITLSARYTPWGNTLELNGTGNFTFGYLGSILDASTGLLYVGNGQYYDPATGRFLTRGVNPNSTNPYVPWNPIGAIIGPLTLFSLVARRKKGKANPYLLMLLILVVLPLSVGLACESTPTPTAPVEQPPATETPGSTTTPESGPSAPGAPTDTPTPCTNCTSTPNPVLDDALHITEEELTIGGVYRADYLETVLREEDPALLVARVSIGERMRSGSNGDQRQDGIYVMWNVKIRVAIGNLHYVIGSYRSGILTPGDLYEELFTPVQYEAMTGTTGLLSEGGAFFGTSEQSSCDDRRRKMANPCPGADTEALREAYTDAQNIWSANLSDAPVEIRGYDTFFGSMTSASACGHGEPDPSYSLPWKQLVPGGNRHFDCVFADNKYFGLPVPP